LEHESLRLREESEEAGARRVFRPQHGRRIGIEDSGRLRGALPLDLCAQTDLALGTAGVHVALAFIE